MCVTACPYKKTYYNWHTGKSEKCILCFPRIEAGLAPACMHSCVGRIRYLGVILYDADKIEQVAASDEKDLVQNHMDIMLDPNDPEVIAAAKENGVADSTIRSAQASPTYTASSRNGAWLCHCIPNSGPCRCCSMCRRCCRSWRLWRLASRPSRPRSSARSQKRWDDDWLYDTSTEELFGTIDQARFPLEYMASLFSAGDTEMIAARIKKLMAVRIYRRFKTVGDISEEKAATHCSDAGLTAKMADDIYYLTSLAKFDDRFVIPAAHREQAIEMMEFTGDNKGSAGFGFKNGTAERGL